MFRTYNKNKNDAQSSYDKRKDESLNIKSSKRESTRKKSKSSDNSNKNLDLTTSTTDYSSENNIEKKAEPKNHRESTRSKRKDKSMSSRSHKKSESKRSKKEEEEEDNSKFKIRDLSTRMIDKLLTKKARLGKGATSIVYKVKNILTNDGCLCLKILNNEFFKKSDIEDKKKEISWSDDDYDFEESDDTIEIDIDKIRQLLQEYEILNQINHPNIVTVYGLYRGDSKHNPAILLEYCKFNLEQVASRIEDIYLVSIIYEICLAMNHVHQNKIIHRDLSIRNILINSEKHVKICDFGIAKVINLTTWSSITHDVGTLAFMAPEVLNRNVKYTEKVDVYSFGVVMYFIVTQGQMPEFTGVGNYINLDMPSNINKLSKRIIKACWSPQPEERPSFKDLLNKIVQKKFLLIDGIEEKIPELKMHLGLD